jgi:hypothetical protein
LGFSGFGTQKAACHGSFAGLKISTFDLFGGAILNLQMDITGTILAWVGLLAFILAIPMNVIANLITPRAETWWATTSSVRRQRRIEKLRRALDVFNSRQEHWADVLLRLLRTFIVILAAASICLGGFLIELHAHIHRMEKALGISVKLPVTRYGTTESSFSWLWLFHHLSQDFARLTWSGRCGICPRCLSSVERRS